MGAARGPWCAGTCDKRISLYRPTSCPWCRLPLCLSCTCPNRCYERVQLAETEADIRRERAMSTAMVAPGDRVTYRAAPADAPTFAGVVREGGCGDKTCGYIHVDSDTDRLHHVSPEDILRCKKAVAK